MMDSSSLMSLVPDVKKTISMHWLVAKLLMRFLIFL